MIRCMFTFSAALIVLLQVAVAGPTDSIPRFTLASLEGKPLTVSVRSIWEGASNGALTIEIDSTHRVCLDECAGLISAKVLSGTFLEVQMAVRGGTGFAVRMYALICASKDSLRLAFRDNMYELLCEPAEPCLSRTPDMIDSTISTHNYALQPEATGWTLQIVAQTKGFSDCTPSKNRVTTDTVRLSFNKEFGVFCEKVDTVSGWLERYLPNGHKEHVDHLVRTPCPAFHVGRSADRADSWYLGGAWCVKEDSTYVITLAHECK